MKKIVSMVAVLIMILIGFQSLAYGETLELIYIYVSPCESCEKAERYIDSLPETIELEIDESSYKNIELNIEKFNIADDVTRAEALFESYGVSSKKRMAPGVFVGEKYISGANVIEKNLIENIHIAASMAEKKADSKEELEDTKVVTPMGLISTFISGLISGLNPCALSMLILFIATALSIGNKGKRAIIIFLLVKFLSYIAIGTIFYSLIRALNLSWLPKVAKIILTIMALSLALINLIDAKRAHDEKYGKIKNQLPLNLRRFLHKTVGNFGKAKKRHVYIATIGLAIIVAISEFLCAGQIYLALILAGIHRGGSFGYWGSRLVTFSTGFIVPSSIVVGVIFLGKSTFLISDWLRERMTLIKILSAMLLVAVVVVSWLSF